LPQVLIQKLSRHSNPHRIRRAQQWRVCGGGPRLYPFLTPKALDSQARGQRSRVAAERHPRSMFNHHQLRRRRYTRDLQATENKGQPTRALGALAEPPIVRRPNPSASGIFSRVQRSHPVYPRLRECPRLRLRVTRFASTRNKNYGTGEGRPSGPIAAPALGGTVGRRSGKNFPIIGFAANNPVVRPLQASM
jgi:hypothetical protein